MGLLCRLTNRQDHTAHLWDSGRPLHPIVNMTNEKKYPIKQAFVCAMLQESAVPAIWTRQTRKQVKVGAIPMALTTCHYASVLIYSQQPPYSVLPCQPATQGCEDANNMHC
ncbi:hypothetical protein DPX16_20473 [Anabarilius grahami]|uniref:Uncharacterized protein n=1 Tax=Anabarilius grahami TaxID=495550 RepID=A0A3N0Z4Y9_ANAGA|nr:hypothetical protein DPX16_20473 [Anabarilius grahami]